ncbi:hypothetical protein JCM3774_005600 [Rhodotorula dairenensis]
MRGPVDSSTLPPDLAARFAALQAPAAHTPDTTPRSPTSPRNDVSDPLERRLEQLITPTKSQIERGVKVEMKGLSPPTAGRRHSYGDQSLPDDEVEQYLAGLDSTSTDNEELIVLPSPPSVQPVRAPGARARQTIPSLSPSLLDTLSGVEVQFFRPSLGAATGDVDADLEAGSEADDLIRRLRDELKLEEKVNSRNEANASRWEERLEGLKGVVAGGARGPDRTGGIGTPPDLGELERQLEKRRIKRQRDGENDDGTSEDGGTSTEEESDEDRLDDSDSEKTGGKEVVARTGPVPSRFLSVRAGPDQEAGDMKKKATRASGMKLQDLFSRSELDALSAASNGHRASTVGASSSARLREDGESYETETTKAFKGALKEIEAALKRDILEGSL